nr:ABC transporter permease [Acidimicrobiia bacterium]
MTAAPGKLGRIASMVRLNLTRNLRSPIYAASIIVIPLVVVLIQGIVVGAGVERYPVGLVVPGGDAAAAAIEARFDGADAIDVRRYDDEDDLRAGLAGDEVVVGVVVPDGFSASVAGGGTVELELLANPTRTVAGAARAAVVAEIEAESAALQAARFAREQAGVSLEAAAAQAAELGTVQLAAARQLADGSEAGTESTFAYGVRGAVVFFMFATALSAAALLVDLRRRGLLRRILATPADPVEVLLAEGASRFAVTLVQAAVLIGAGWVLFDVRWGDPLAVAAVVVAWSAVCTVAALLLGAASSTFEQAITIGSAAAIALGMAGSCLWPLDVTPPELRRFAELTPHWWAMDGMLEAATGSLADVAPNVLGLG